jgi:excisionase family DNA binding protein
VKNSDLVKDGLLTSKEAVSFLRIGRSKLYLLCESGDVPFVKIGKARRIPRRALEVFAERFLIGGSR